MSDLFNAVISNNYEEVYKLLLTHNYDPNVFYLNDRGNSHQSEAMLLTTITALNGYERILQLLISNGANINYHGDTPFYQCIGMNNYDAAIMLLENGLELSSNTIDELDLEYKNDFFKYVSMRYCDNELDDLSYLMNKTYL